MKQSCQLINLYSQVPNDKSCLYFNKNQYIPFLFIFYLVSWLVS